MASTHRADPATLSVDDEATVEFGPGLLRFLSAVDPAGRVLAEGFAMDWALPLGAAASAAITVVSPPALAGLNTFTGAVLTASWGRPWMPTETLVAECRIQSLGKSSARLPFRVVSASDGALIVEGEYVYVNVGPDGPRPFRRSPNASDGIVSSAAASLPPSGHTERPPRSETAPTGETEVESRSLPLFRLRSPVLLTSVSSGALVRPGDVSTWTFPNDLFRLLVNPLAGGTDPIARRAHPFSNIQVAMSIHSAIAMAPGAPRQVTVEWMEYLVGATDFDLRSEIVTIDDEFVVSEHIVSEGGKAKTKIKLTIGRGDEDILGDSGPRASAPSTEAIEVIDLEAKIAAINPEYLRESASRGRFMSRIQQVHSSTSDGLLYLIYADAFVFVSADQCDTLTELREVNYRNGRLVTSGGQSIDAVVDTMRRTVLLLGTDDRDGLNRGVVWRKTQGESAFSRSVTTEEAWSSSKAGNVAAGFFGKEQIDMVAAAMYAPGAHLYFSVDDGVSWRRQDLANVFAEHVHEVYLARNATPGRAARLWITGGDDPSGAHSGVICYDGLSSSGLLEGFQFVLRERPGYRLVGLGGNGKHVFVGNESLAGGVLKILDDQESIDATDFEYVLGKNRHDYHQFRSLVATVDGFLVSASDSYASVSDTVRADSGGYIYVSSDEGVTFREISVGAKWVPSVTSDGRAFWATISSFREGGVDISDARHTLLRIPKPPSSSLIRDPYCVKAVVMDSSLFYETAGYRDHPRAKLEAGEHTFRVDMSKYRSISVAVETWTAATLVVEALPFSDWKLSEDRWTDVEHLVLDRPGARQVMLTDLAAHNRYFRVRNDGTRAVELRSLVFIGRT